MAMSTHKSTRRQFLRTTASASVGAATFPYIVPASALGKAGTVAPSNRIVMGAIGTGGKGTNNMQTFLNFPEVQVVAVCDVDAKNRNKAKGIVDAKYGNKDCKGYKDFRELCARDDINAVSIGTPDHWHAITTIEAANKGKDIYCEKPLANSVAEGRAMVEAVKKNNRILQCGSHERSTTNVRFACELVRNGRLGEVKTVHINLPCSDGHHKKAQELAKQDPPAIPVPDGFDYDFWLGHTKMVPYNEYRTHFWWRFNLRYGGGEMTDRGAHVIDLAQLGLDMDETGPVEFKARGTRNSDPNALFDAFFDYKFENVYANGARLLGTTNGPRGLKFEGSDGWVMVHVHGGKLEAEPSSLLSATVWPDKVFLGRSRSHHYNFIEGVKRRKQPFAPAEAAHRTASICHINNIGMILGRDLKWEPKAEKFIGDDEANALLTPKMRAPWHL
ncbi:MAG: Gfo/Idh/MocA family oxidoreductase [Phycisphaerae bacterium]|nr:Gfo/Idh/MocA family oxidoreductase [Phycisphaerae bacterium]